MYYFSIPADFKVSTLHHIKEINSKYKNAIIYETYGQLSVENIIGSGRASDLIPNIDIGCLKHYIEESKRLGINFNYTLNASCLGNAEFSRKGISQIREFLLKLKDIGVSYFTVASPALMQIIHEMNCGFEIKASTVCCINSANKALLYKDELAKHIVVDESINRDFFTLKAIRSVFGSRVEVIVNVICHKDCIYEQFHHNQTSHDIDSDKQSATFYSHRCMLQRCKTAGTLLKLAWIRPEDLHLYESIGIQYFKLQGRQAVKDGDIMRTVEAYFEETYEGNLMDLLNCFSPTNSFDVNLPNGILNDFITPFYNIPNFCSNNCTSCKYCDDFIKKKMDISHIEQTFDMARQFYEAQKGLYEE